jgi:hypothetical protein
MSTPEGPESAGRGMSAEHSPLPWRAFMPWRGDMRSDPSYVQAYVVEGPSGPNSRNVLTRYGLGATDADWAVVKANAAFIVKAVNNHDALLASLKEMHAFAAACMRVVVKPEHAACAAALDAEVAAAGIADGFGVRAQEALEKATVTHG